MQYNHKLKHGKLIKDVSFYLPKFIKTLIFLVVLSNQPSSLLLNQQSSLHHSEVVAASYNCPSLNISTGHRAISAKK